MSAPTPASRPPVSTARIVPPTTASRAGWIRRGPHRLAVDRRIAGLPRLGPRHEREVEVVGERGRHQRAARSARTGPDRRRPERRLVNRRVPVADEAERPPIEVGDLVDRIDVGVRVERDEHEPAVEDLVAHVVPAGDQRRRSPKHQPPRPGSSARATSLRAARARTTAIASASTNASRIDTPETLVSSASAHADPGADRVADGARPRRRKTCGNSNVPAVRNTSCSVWFEKNPATCSAAGRVANIARASTRARRDSRRYTSSADPHQQQLHAGADDRHAARRSAPSIRRFIRTRPASRRATGCRSRS